MVGVINEYTDKYVVISIPNENIFNLKMAKAQYDKHIQLNFSATYHCIQGQTIKDMPLVLNTDKLFDKKMAYTGVSRVTKQELLYRLE